jgi:hypothetical protein
MPSSCLFFLCFRAENDNEEEQEEEEEEEQDDNEEEEEEVMVMCENENYPLSRLAKLLTKQRIGHKKSFVTREEKEAVLKNAQN